MSAPRYAELQVTTEFSFLRGASSAEELFATAAARGIEAMAVVDRNSLAGIVRAHQAAKASGVRLIVGCRLDLAASLSVLVYPTDRAAYARLCRLLTLGKGRAGKERAGKGKCPLDWADLAAYGEGLIAVLLPDLAGQACGLRLRRLRDAFGDRAYLALTLRRRPNDQMRLWELSRLAQRIGVPTVVTNDVLFHDPGRRRLQDVVTVSTPIEFSPRFDSSADLNLTHLVCVCPWSGRAPTMGADLFRLPPGHGRSGRPCACP